MRFLHYVKQIQECFFALVKLFILNTIKIITNLQTNTYRLPGKSKQSFHQCLMSINYFFFISVFSSYWLNDSYENKAVLLLRIASCVRGITCSASAWKVMGSKLSRDTVFSLQDARFSASMIDARTKPGPSQLSYKLYLLLLFQMRDINSTRSWECLGTKQAQLITVGTSRQRYRNQRVDCMLMSMARINSMYDGSLNKRKTKS